MKDHSLFFLFTLTKTRFTFKKKIQQTKKTHTHTSEEVVVVDQWPRPLLFGPDANKVLIKERRLHELFLVAIDWSYPLMSIDASDRTGLQSTLSIINNELTNNKIIHIMNIFFFSIFLSRIRKNASRFYFVSIWDCVRFYK